ncbi:MAG: sugar transferase [Chitinophagales bacterium]|jgi:O-antigen biosynthesis protein WbqP|nr:sugar transferase [Sphingobacteriales bacterium]
MKRLFDITLLFFATIFFFLPFLITGLLVKLTSKGPILYWSNRVGKDNEIFKMPKFRSMKIDTPAVATHLLQNPDIYLTPIGNFIRKTSLDELPQLWCLWKNQMSVVGPRPALYNQYDLIELRTQKNVHKLLPGITGWAQVNGRDELSIEEKVKFDVEYLDKKSLWFDIKIIIITILKVIKLDGIKH